MFATYYKRYDPYWSSKPGSVPFFPGDLPPRPLCSLPAFPKLHEQSMASAVATMQRRHCPITIAHPRPSKVLPDPSFLTMPLELASEDFFTGQHRTRYAAPIHRVSDTSSTSQITSAHPTPRSEPPTTRASIAGPSTARNNHGIKSGAEIGVDRRLGPHASQHRELSLQRIAPRSLIANGQIQDTPALSGPSPVAPSLRREKVGKVDPQRRSVDSPSSTGETTAGTAETKRKRKANTQTQTTKKKPRLSVSRAS